MVNVVVLNACSFRQQPADAEAWDAQKSAPSHDVLLELQNPTTTYM